MSPALVLWLGAAAVRASLLLAFAAVAARLLRQGSAAARHQVWALGVFGALLEPALAAGLPGWVPAGGAGSGSGVGLVTLKAGVVSGGAGVAAGVDWPAAVAAVWALGALGVGLRFARAHLAAAWLWRGAAPVPAGAAGAAAEQAAATLGLPPAAARRLRQRAGLASPLSVGVFSPGVLLPVGAAEGPAEALRAVLLHELAHVRRRDAIVQLAAQLLCAAYWWNPLAWWAASRLRIEREHACDDLVLGAGVRPSSYASLLLGMVRAGGSARPLEVGLGMAGFGATEARLRRILDGSAVRRSPGAAFRWATRGAVAALAVGLGCSASPPPVSVGAEAVAARPASAVDSSQGADSAPAADVGPVRPGKLVLGALVELPRVPEDERPPEALMEARRGMASITAELQPQLGAVERCYQARLAQRPGLSGEIVVHWTILADGTVPESCTTTDTVQDEAVTECVNAVVRDFLFSPSVGEAVSVDIPFSFSAGP